MVHELNKTEAEKSREFVNLHRESRKRRFDDINSNNINKFSMSRNEGGIGDSTNNPFGQTANIQSNSSTSQNLIFNRRKILLTNMVASYCSDEEVEKIISDLTGMNKDQAKEYLKKTISQLISKNFLKFFKIFKKILEEKSSKSSSTPTVAVPNRESLIQQIQQMETQEDKKNLEEMKSKIETLLGDNADLKRVAVVMYKRENVKILFFKYLLEP